MAPDGIADRAATLATRWAASGGAHVAFGAGCGCGGGLGAIGPAELDDLTVRYLRSKYQDDGRDGLVRFIAGTDGALLTIDAILARLTGATALDPGDAALLLDDLGRTIGSFEEMHRAGR